MSATEKSSWFSRPLGMLAAMIGGNRDQGGGNQAVRYQDGDSLASPGGWLVKEVNGGKTKSGVHVSEFAALHLPVVYACVNRIGNPIARFPLRMYQAIDDRKKRQLTEKDHPFAAQIGLRPNEFMSSRTFRKTVQGHALLWGNGYCEIERNQAGQAIGLFPLKPWATQPVLQRGDFFFRSTIGGQSVEMPSEDVVHIMDQSQDGYVGISQIAMARQAVGMGLAMEEFGAKFFANDMKSGGFLMHPGKLSGNAQGNIRGRNGDQKANPASPAASLESQSGIENAHRVKVLEEGMKFIQTTIPPEDAQFLGSREFQIAEIARIYDVPLILLQSQEKQTSFGAGIEQLMIGFVRQTIDPWINAWEEELNYKLFTDAERANGYYVKFNMNALLRGDMAARAAYYRELFGVGGLSPNNILALEDMDDIGPAGDHHFVPSNFITLDKATDPNFTVGSQTNQSSGPNDATEIGEEDE